MLLPWVAGFVAYQLTAPTVLSAWPGWEAFWRHGQDLLHISPTNGFSASLVALAVAGAAHPARLSPRIAPMSLFTEKELAELRGASWPGSRPSDRTASRTWSR